MFKAGFSAKGLEKIFVIKIRLHARKTKEVDLVTLVFKELKKVIKPELVPVVGRVRNERSKNEDVQKNPFQIKNLYGRSL